jgi:hypothetical protein
MAKVFSSIVRSTPNTGRCSRPLSSPSKIAALSPVVRWRSKIQGRCASNKIIRIIKGCALGIHDISRTELNDERLPRFNMPYELGLFIGCAAFGSGASKHKKALILDSERYRFAKFISDIAGQDIQDHGNDPAQVIRKVRNWLANHAHGARVPGGDTILQRFNEFCADLGNICAKLRLSQIDLDNFCDFHNCVTEWLIANTKPNAPA